MTPNRFVALTVLAIATSKGNIAIAVSYKITQLAGPSFVSSWLTGVSVARQVGSGRGPTTSDQLHALLWNGMPESVVDLHPDGFAWSSAEGVSGDHQVGSGGGPATGGQSHALLWSGTAASVVDLHPDGFIASDAMDVSGAHQVGSGSGPATGGQSHALFWSGTAASVVDLHPDGFIASRALGASGDYQVGWGSGPATGGQSRALLWSGTAANVVDLHPEGFIASSAAGASSDHQVGWGYTAGSKSHALMWSHTAEGFVDLHPDGYTSSAAADVSNGIQVGYASVATMSNLGDLPHAFVWHGSAASAIDLHQYLSPNFTRSIATGVGEDGTIVGVARYDTFNPYIVPYYEYAVMWTPVPEPSTWTLLGAALIVQISRRRYRRPGLSRWLLIAAALFPLVTFTNSAHADIFQWEYVDPADPSQGKRQSTMLTPDGAGVDAVPGAYLSGRNLTMAYLIGADLTDAYGPANLTNADLSQANLTNASLYGTMLTGAEFSGAEIRGANFGVYTFYARYGTGISLQQLYSTASYQAKDLSGVGFDENYLDGADFVGQNLTDASFYLAGLNNADFTGAVIRGANFGRLSYNISYFTGIRLEQLYSTASYHVGDLSGIDFLYNFLHAANFAGQNLTNTNFYGATLTAADFTAADTRGASLDSRSGPGAVSNLIRTDGHIFGLDLHGSNLLIVRDYDGDSRYDPTLPPIPIKVDQHLTMGPGGTLRMVFEADAWDSTISFAPGIPVALGGTLELTFADDVNLATQLGRTQKIFDWTGVTPTGSFAVSSPYRWDTSNLYTTGEVTLTAVPESSALHLSGCALCAFVAMGRL